MSNIFKKIVSYLFGKKQDDAHVAIETIPSEVIAEVPAEIHEKIETVEAPDLSKISSPDSEKPFANLKMAGTGSVTTESDATPVELPKTRKKRATSLPINPQDKATIKKRAPKKKKDEPK